MTRRLGSLLLLSSLLLTGRQPARGEPPVGEAKQGPTPSSKVARTDQYGDPLPEGVIARLGTSRLRPGFAVDSLMFTPDGKTLLFADSGSDNDAAVNFIGFYDPSTGARLRGIPGHPSFRSSYHQVLSPDGKTLATIGNGDGVTSLFLLDVGTGRWLREFGKHDALNGASLHDLAFSPDGKGLATVGARSGIEIWDPATGKRRRRLAATDAERCVSYSPDGRFLAAGGEAALQFWDVAAGKMVWQVRKASGHGVEAVAFSPDGKTLAVIDEAGSVFLVAPADGKELRHWQAHSRDEEDHYGTRPVVFSPDGKTLASGGDDGAICFWDPLTGEKKRELRGHFRAVWSLAFSPDGRTLASGSDDDTVRLWDTAAGRERPTFDGHRCRIDSIAFSPDGKVLASRGFDDREGRLWDPERGKLLQVLPDCYTAMVYSPDGKLLAYADKSRFMRLRDPGTGRAVRSLQGREAHGYRPKFHPDGRVLATVGPGPLIRVWDAATGEERVRLSNGHKPKWVDAVAFSPDGKLLASVEERMFIRLWDWGAGREVLQLGDLQAPVEGIAFAPDGKTLAAAAGYSGAVRFWRVKDGEERPYWITDHRVVDVIAISPDGRLLAAAGRYERFVSLWEVVTGKQLLRLTGHLNGVHAIAFSPDGRRVASGSSDFTVLVWDLPAALGGEVVRPADPEQCWKDLADDDAKSANRAVWQLAKMPARSVPMLSERMRPVPRVAAGRISRLIADLDDDDFDVRARATAALHELGDVTEPALRKAVRESASEEVRRRAEDLLSKVAPPVPPAEQLRLLRALAVLEEVGTAEARRLLQSLADGESEARLTQEARAALKRLAGRDAKPR
jgi:WD40 repeat protein